MKTTTDLTHLECLQMMAKEVSVNQKARDEKMALLEKQIVRLREDMELVKEAALSICRSMRRLQETWGEK